MSEEYFVVTPKCTQEIYKEKANEIQAAESEVDNNDNEVHEAQYNFTLGKY